MTVPRILNVLFLGACLFVAGPANAEPGEDSAPVAAQEALGPTTNGSMLARASFALQDTVIEALNQVGIRYRRGGSSPESGFDCSGFVTHVYEQSLGLILPHNARAMSKEGEQVDRQALQPGDLVFFNTMRRAFSHVGIYLGDGLFVHAPRSGEQVRVENMQNGYWKKRYNGARRVAQ